MATLRDTIVAASGLALAVAMDVADVASVIAAYDRAEAAFGAVDTVVVNAGIDSEAAALDLGFVEFDQVFAINVRGVFLTAREGSRRVIAAGSAERENGRIVLISSITADVMPPGLALYSGSKAAMVQMGRGLARDWVRRGINADMILPGYVRAEVTEAWSDSDAGQRQIACLPRRRCWERPIWTRCCSISRRRVGGDRRRVLDRGRLPVFLNTHR